MFLKPIKNMLIQALKRKKLVKTIKAKGRNCFLFQATFFFAYGGGVQFPAKYSKTEVKSSEYLKVNYQKLKNTNIAGQYYQFDAGLHYTQVCTHRLK